MSKTRFLYKRVLFKIIFFLGVILFEQASLLLAMYIIYGSDRLMDKTLADYFFSIPLNFLISLFLYDYLKLSNFQYKPGLSILLDSFKFVALFFAATCILAYLLNLYALSRYALLFGSIIFFFILTLWSIVIQGLSKRFYKKNSILIVSDNQDSAEKIITKIQCEQSKLHLQIIGWSKPEEVNEERLHDASSVLIASTVDEKPKFDILVLCSKMNKMVYIVPTFYDLSFSQYRIIKFYDTPTFQIENGGLTFQQQLLKRVFDIFFSSIVLLLTSPLLLLIAVIIKLDSKGPIFYLQDRITFNGKIYKIFKFRTMIDEAEKIFGAYQSVGKDHRVTRFGAFLRKTHLDELPQFANVLLGSMSVVGPRSDRTITIDLMDNQATGYSYRLKAKSGITGLAQLFGKYNSDPEDKLRYDMYYIKNYSLIFDVQLILLTVLAMIPKPNKVILKAGSDYYIDVK